MFVVVGLLQLHVAAEWPVPPVVFVFLVVQLRAVAEGPVHHVVSVIQSQLLAAEEWPVHQAFAAVHLVFVVALLLVPAVGEKGVTVDVVFPPNLLSVLPVRLVLAIVADL